MKSSISTSVHAVTRSIAPLIASRSTIPENATRALLRTAWSRNYETRKAASSNGTKSTKCFTNSSEMKMKVHMMKKKKDQSQSADSRNSWQSAMQMKM